MSDLGSWTPFIAAEPQMSGWYQLHPEQQEQLDHYVFSPKHMEPLPREEWASVFAAVRSYTDLSVGMFNNSYHNPWHFGAVRQDGMDAIAMYERLTGIVFPGAVKQAYELALYTHDCHHCGATFRTDTFRPELLHMPEVGQRVSQEWVSAVATNRLCLWLGIPLPWRLFMAMVHYASTFGGSTPKGQELGIPVVVPQSLWGCVMQASDVVPVEHFTTVKRIMLAVMCGEVPAGDPPTSMDELLTAQLGFYDNYVTVKLDRLDAVAGIPLTEELGWRTRLHDARQGIVALKRGDDPEALEQLREDAMQNYNCYL